MVSVNESTMFNIVHYFCPYAKIVMFFDTLALFKKNFKTYFMASFWAKLENVCRVWSN